MAAAIASANKILVGRMVCILGDGMPAVGNAAMVH